MRARVLFLSFSYIFFSAVSFAAKLFIPMDATSQANHLKAYGIAYAAMQQGTQVDWLLNYKGGSFALEYRDDMADLCKQRGVTFVKMSNKQYAGIVKLISAPDFNGQVVKLEKAPKIAVYTPPNKKPWDDAVTLALTYAEIPFDKIYADEVLKGDLEKYDWLHLHHEDFTGQYGKFWSQFHNAEWYRNDQKTMEEMAQRNGFKKVSQMQLAVVKKIRDFVSGGGNMFAMCSATTTFDIALAAENTDICDNMFDGDAIDPAAQSKLDFTKCLAFKDFKITTDAWEYSHSNINNANRTVPGTYSETGYYTMSSPQKDVFTLYTSPAKFDQVPAMLCQNHTSTIKGFMGQNTAFRKELLKPGVQILADFPQCYEARYIHGELGKGSWTFLGGHDPEDYQHLVGDPATDLSQHPNSPGYRLILNNVLFPAVKAAPVQTVVVNSNASNPENKTTAPYSVENVVADKSIRLFPNPTNNEIIITLTPGKIERVIIQDISGKTIIDKAYNAEKVNVSLKTLVPGLYLVQVNGDYVGKVVKE